MKIQNTTRRFLGKTDNFSSKIEAHFFDRMLRAYLKGKEVFQFGFERIDNLLHPRYHKVMQEYK